MNREFQKCRTKLFDPSCVPFFTRLLCRRMFSTLSKRSKCFVSFHILYIVPLFAALGQYSCSRTRARNERVSTYLLSVARLRPIAIFLRPLDRTREDDGQGEGTSFPIENFGYDGAIVARQSYKLDGK